MSGQVFTLSGPAGVGKGTLAALVTMRDAELYLSVSCTTRPIGRGEEEGLNYFFVSNERFDEMIARDEFYEWARVHGNRYGTPKAPVEAVLAQGRNALLEIDVQGSAKVIAKRPDAKSIFILPPSREALVSRMKRRDRDTPQDMRVRLANAAWEIAHARDCRYAVVNADMEKAAGDVLRIIHGEGDEDFLVSRQLAFIGELEKSFQEEITL